MKTRNIIIFFAMVLFAGILETEANAQVVTWQKWYDYQNREDNGQDIIQASDNGYVILSNNYGAGFSSVLTKIDFLGNLTWQKLLNIGEQTLTFSVSEQDSGYLVAGYTATTAILIRTGLLGDTLWVKRYNYPGFPFSRFKMHKSTEDNCILAYGTLLEPDIGYLVKSDSVGNLIWQKKYNETGYIVQVIEDKDGNLFLLGHDSAFVTPLSVVIKTDPEGNFIWKKNLNMEIPVEIMNIKDNIFICGGRDKFTLIKMDTSGNIIFQENYFAGVLGCGAACLSKDENILLTGEKKVNLGFLMAVSRVDLNGGLINDKIIHSLKIKENYSFIPRAVKSTNDRGFVFTGFTDYPHTSHESNIYVTKTDSSCNAPLIVGIDDNSHISTNTFVLHQNYPNPFNSSTVIKYQLAKPSFVELIIYDIKGSVIQKLVDEYQNSGEYEVRYTPDELPSGILFYMLKANKISQIRKFIFLK